MKSNDDAAKKGNYKKEHKFKRIIEGIMQQAFHDLTNQDLESGVIYAYGFHVHIGKDDTSHIQLNTLEFFDSINMPFKFTEFTKKDHHFDYIEYFDSIAITIEVSAVAKENISITAQDKQVIITMTEKNWNYREEISLPCSVDSSSIYYTYKNGILDIILRKEYLLR